jgi:hypothetical protein
MERGHTSGQAILKRPGNAGLHGIRIDARKTYLFAFLDDHSRLLPGYRWGYAELCRVLIWGNDLEFVCLCR